VPSLNVKGEAARLMNELGAARCHLSISHTTEHAIAEVILED
jgi:phosphopantetheinyl transferase (holo-ACP synthase)